MAEFGKLSAFLLEFMIKTIKFSSEVLQGDNEEELLKEFGEIFNLEIAKQ